MAEICIEATATGDVRYELALDEEDATIDMVDGRGCGDVNGTCGDGSEHRLYYQLFGAPGAKLTITLFCDNEQRDTYQLNTYPPGGAVGGYVSFVL